MALYLALAVGGIAALVYRQDWSTLVYTAVWTIGLLLIWAWREVVVNADGIRLSWFEQRRLKLPARLVPWDQVESVEKFDHSRTHVHIRLVDGRTVPLLGLPGERSEAVAVLGTKPVRARRVASIKNDRTPTERQVDAELRQRAAALAAERDELKRISEGIPRVPRQLRRSE
ncbi:hypothetical protein GCM10009539_25150 [Cryptosporangium japonicum]|uniref:Low molecular weight protein antigen 6 PH domain-containing protein n=1 Tax=Cryptosporangium japonicum TaxID=80872 RepID=A0ABN0U4V1_9ACTN